MKKSIKITLIMLALLIITLIASNIVLANTKSIILKKADKYLIYNENAMNEEFTFALGTENQAKDSLIFYPSAKDSNEEGAKNVAYIDDTTSSYLNENSEAFLFIRNKAGEYIVESEKISLKNAVDKEKVESITKLIKVDLTQNEVKTETINNVVTEVTKGKVVITDSNENKYSYILIKLPTDTENDYTKLMNLAEKISNKTEIEKLSFMEKLELMSEFNTLYTKLAPKTEDNAWLEVQNSEILQPQDSKSGEKYIVFIKSVKDDETIIDAQFMTCYDEYSPLYEKETITIKETSKLPVTYDTTITLIIVLVVIVVAIIVLLIIRKKVSKKDANK